MGLTPLVALLLAAAPAPAPAPRFVLWAWERPEELTFLAPGEAEVAALLGTFRFTAAGLERLPRRQPLHLPAGTKPVAVFRIESHLAQPLPAAGPEFEALVTTMVGWAERAGATHLQVDFDASASERPAYAALLTALRARWPAPRTLSITALASWCLDDPWLGPLPIDFAVPQLFRMGTGRDALRRRLATLSRFTAPKCEAATGFSADELRPGPRGTQQTFLFSPVPWTAERFHALARELSP